MEYDLPERPLEDEVLQNLRGEALERYIAGLPKYLQREVKSFLKSGKELDEEYERSGLFGFAVRKMSQAVRKDRTPLEKHYERRGK